MQGRSRGASLLAVMALSMVVLTVLLVVSSVATARMNLVGRSRGEAKAVAAAESAISRAVADFLQNRPPSSSPPPADLVLQDDFSESSSRLTWDSNGKLPYSTNNWDTDSSRTGWGGRPVPGRSIHFVALGQSGGVERVVEALVHIPPFPYVIASSGVIDSDGGLLVTGVSDAKDVALQDGVLVIPEEKQTAGHVVANGSGSPALALGPDTEVTGDVRSAGEIALDASAIVRGEVRPGQDPVGIPKLDIRSYDPAGRPAVQSLEAEYPSETYPGRLQIEGFVRRSGDLLVASGGVKMNGAVLFVDGDLEVHGPLEGKGALIVTGSCNLQGGAVLSTDNEAALVVGGDVTIHGTGRQSTFVGLVYTEGDFTAEDITLVGAFVANRAIVPGSAMRMNRVNLVSMPAKSDFSWETSFSSLDSGKVTLGGLMIESTANMKDFAVVDPPVLGEDAYDPARLSLETAKFSYTFQSRKYSREGLLNAIRRTPLPKNRTGECASATNWTDYIACSESAIISDMRSKIQSANQEWLSVRVDTGRFEVDLNRFVNIEDRARIVLTNTDLHTQDRK